MTKRKIHDISQALQPGIPAWPGDTPYSEARTWQYGPDCPVNVSQFQLSSHCGTHVDAPFHYDPDGARIAQLDLDAFVGPARVIDLRGRGKQITPEMIEPFLEGMPTRVLLRTWESFPYGRWQPDYAVPNVDAVKLLAQRGVQLLGTDAPSIDPHDSKTLDAHLAVRDAGMLILEGLVLDDIEAGDYELTALPLKLSNLDGSPVRAVLRELPQ